MLALSHAMSQVIVFNATFRLDYSKKDANSEAIWGYQQIAGYSLTETSQVFMILMQPLRQVIFINETM